MFACCRPEGVFVTPLSKNTDGIRQPLAEPGSLSPTGSSHRERGKTNLDAEVL